MNEKYYTFDKDNNTLLSELNFDEFQDFYSIIGSYKKYENVLLGYEFVCIAYREYQKFYGHLSAEDATSSSDSYKMGAYHITQYIMFAKTYIEYCQNYNKQMENNEILIKNENSLINNFSIELLDAIRNYTMHLAIPLEYFLTVKSRSDNLTFFVFSIFKKKLLEDKYLRNHNKVIIEKVEGEVINFSDYIHTWHDIITEFHSTLSKEYLSRVPEDIRKITKLHYTDHFMNVDTEKECFFTSIAIVKYEKSEIFSIDSFDFSSEFLKFIMIKED